MTTPLHDPLSLCGKTIADKYRIEAVIGEGGHAVVYRAWHLIFKAPVAIKCLRALSAAPEEIRQTLLEEFIAEGRIMAQLSAQSASIVQSRDVGTLTTDEGCWIPYIVMEWLDGKPLDAVMSEEDALGMPPRTLAQVVTLLNASVDALDVAHANDIAHRDIKPENLFVLGDPRSPRARIKVLDFGIAKVMGGKLGTALLQTGVNPTPFTPNYGAPEQFSRAIGATGPWTDVFAMALVVLELVRGGQRVFDDDDYIDVARASQSPIRPTPRALGLNVTDAIEAVFQKALSISPADRYRRIGDFWFALKTAVDADVPISSVPDALLGPAPSIRTVYDSSQPAALPSRGSLPLLATRQPQSTPPQSTLPPHSTLQALRPRATLWGIALATIATIAVAGTFIWQHKSAQASAMDPTVAESLPSAVDLPGWADAPQCPGGSVLIEGGNFFMGSDDASFAPWLPAHRVSVSPYCLDVEEATVKRYRACVEEGSCTPPARTPDYPKATGKDDAAHHKAVEAQAELCNWGADDRSEHPINCVTWHQAYAFCRFENMRLPTEAEWEFAARGSDGRTFPWGDKPGHAEFMNACGTECTKWEHGKGLPESARMYDEDDGYAGTAPVGAHPGGATLFGIQDMVGNVWEWTGDWYEPYPAGEQTDPLGPVAGDRKVIRGGGFNGGHALWLNPAFRYHQIPSASAPGIGFRCAAEPTLMDG